MFKRFLNNACALCVTKSKMTYEQNGVGRDTFTLSGKSMSVISHFLLTDYISTSCLLTK